MQHTAHSPSSSRISPNLTGLAHNLHVQVWPITVTFDQSLLRENVMGRDEPGVPCSHMHLPLS